MKVKQRIFYVYVYLDIRKKGKFIYKNLVFNFEPFYVGKGHRRRKYKHIYNALKLNYKGNKFRRIRKIKEDTRKLPQIIMMKNKLYDEDALQLEMEIIKTIGRKSLKKGPLLNLTDGGEGVSGLIFSKEHCKRMSDAQKEIDHPNFTFKGRVHSTKTRKK